MKGFFLHKLWRRVDLGGGGGGELQENSKADVSSVSPSSERRENAFRWLSYIINSVDKTKLSCLLKTCFKQSIVLILAF